MPFFLKLSSLLLLMLSSSSSLPPPLPLSPITASSTLLPLVLSSYPTFSASSVASSELPSQSDISCQLAVIKPAWSPPGRSLGLRLE